MERSRSRNSDMAEKLGICIPNLRNDGRWRTERSSPPTSCCLWSSSNAKKNVAKPTAQSRHLFRAYEVRVESLNLNCPTFQVCPFAITSFRTSGYARMGGYCEREPQVYVRDTLADMKDPVAPAVLQIPIAPDGWRWISHPVQTSPRSAVRESIC